MSDLVGNPEDRFYHNEAHIKGGYYRDASDLGNIGRDVKHNCIINFKQKRGHSELQKLLRNKQAPGRSFEPQIVEINT